MSLRVFGLIVRTIVLLVRAHWLEWRLGRNLAAIARQHDALAYVGVKTTFIRDKTQRIRTEMGR